MERAQAYMYLVGVGRDIHLYARIQRVGTT